jgi:hypothetical protein
LTLDPQNQAIASKIDQAKAKMTSNPANTPAPILPAPSGAARPSPESSPVQP